MNVSNIGINPAESVIHGSSITGKTKLLEKTASIARAVFYTLAISTPVLGCLAKLNVSLACSIIGSAIFWHIFAATAVATGILIACETFVVMHASINNCSEFEREFLAKTDQHMKEQLGKAESSLALRKSETEKLKKELEAANIKNRNQVEKNTNLSAELDSERKKCKRLQSEAKTAAEMYSNEVNQINSLLNEEEKAIQLIENVQSKQNDLSKKIEAARNLNKQLYNQLDINEELSEKELQSRLKHEEAEHQRLTELNNSMRDEIKFYTILQSFSYGGRK